MSSHDDIIRFGLTNDFKAFVKYFWNEVENIPLAWGQHLDALCSHLQAMRDGEIQNLLINLPPRCSKSVLCSILFPVWLWLSNPQEQILTASYGMELSSEFSHKAKKLMECEKFKTLFPYLQIDEQTNTKTHYENTSGGKRRAVSVGSATTGFNATFVIVDDLHTIKKRESEAERRAAIDYYRSDLSSRAVLTTKVRTLVIGQRIHADDVSGFIIDNFAHDPGWSFLVLPMEFQEGREPLNNSLGFSDWRTKPGEILWPEVVSPELIKRKKIEHRHDYPCLFNQDTVNREGDLFKAEWFRTFRETEGAYVFESEGVERVVRKASCSRIQTVDVAVSTSASADYTVCVTADLNCGNIFVIDVYRAKLDGSKLVPTLQKLYRSFSPGFMAIEKSGQQGIIIGQLRSAGVTVRAVSPEGKDKEVRSIPAQVKFESGQVYFKAGASWVQDLEAELLAFPRGRHDDQVDALSYLVLLAQRWDRSLPEATEEELAERRKTEQEKRFYDLLWSGL